MGSTAIAIQADVTSQEAIDEMFKIIEKTRYCKYSSQ